MEGVSCSQKIEGSVRPWDCNIMRIPPNTYSTLLDLIFLYLLSIYDTIEMGNSDLEFLMN